MILLNQILLWQVSKYVDTYDYIVFGIDRFDKTGFKPTKSVPEIIEMNRDDITKQLYAIGEWKEKGIRNWGVSNKALNIKLILNQRFPDSLNIGEDLIFLLKALENVDKGLYIGKCFYHYRQRESSITHLDIGNYEELVKEVFELTQNGLRNISAKYMAFLGYLFLLVSLYPRICFKCSYKKAVCFRDILYRK